MTDFAPTTPFGLARRLAAARQDSPSLYLLICQASAIEAVQVDITAEVQVQLGLNLRSLAASEVQPERLEEAFARSSGSPVVLIRLDRWAPKLIDSLDRNIVLVTTVGPVLLLTTIEVAQRALASAPNLRNRLTDVLAIRPDEAFGGARA